MNIEPEDVEIKYETKTSTLNRCSVNISATYVL